MRALRAVSPHRAGHPARTYSACVGRLMVHQRPSIRRIVAAAVMTCASMCLHRARRIIPLSRYVRVCPGASVQFILLRCFALLDLTHKKKHIIIRAYP